MLSLIDPLHFAPCLEANISITSKARRFYFSTHYLLHLLPTLANWWIWLLCINKRPAWCCSANIQKY